MKLWGSVAVNEQLKNTYYTLAIKLAICFLGGWVKVTFVELILTTNMSKEAI